MRSVWHWLNHGPVTWWQLFATLLVMGALDLPRRDHRDRLIAQKSYDLGRKIGHDTAYCEVFQGFVRAGHIVGQHALSDYCAQYLKAHAVGTAETVHVP